MEQNEAAVTDLAPKKIARQKLDFFAASPNGQPQLQLHVPPSQTPQPQIQVQPVVHRIPHPVRKLPLPPMPQSKQESPGSRLKCNLEVKDGTPKKGKQCNCRNSRCLKLYCECFASGSYCNGCNCVNCYNNVENEKFRQDAIRATLERNPNAFRPKIASSPHGSRDAREDPREAQMLGRHNKGCNCKKSGCLKKYCECFQANILCSENCKCMECKNFEESEERKALFHGALNGVSYIHQAANAAINGAVGCSGFVPHLACKKRKIEEVSDMATNYQFICDVAKSQQDYHLRNTAASSSPLSIPVSRATNGAVTGSSKLTYRSPLAGMFQFQDVMEFCSILVVLSRETANVLEGRQRDVDQQAKRENNETAASPKQEVGGSLKEHDTRKTEHDSHLNGIDAKRNESNDCGTVGDEMENGRLGSPEIDLMCHEQEMLFTKVESPTGLKKVIRSKSLKPSSENEFSAIYAEQERLILTGLQDCLNRLITCASMKETMHSPLATSKTGNPQEPAEREGP